MMNFHLRNVPLFQNLSDVTIIELSGLMESRTLKNGEILFNQGDTGDALVIVNKGRIALFSPGCQPIRVISSGEFFGEIALIDRKPRSLSARAEGKTQVFLLKRDEFQELMAKKPDIVDSVLSGLCERVRYTTDFLNEVHYWVSNIAEGNYKTENIINDLSFQKDQSISSLAAEFAHMASVVQARESTLRNEVERLRIEIDEVKRKSAVEDIMDSDYYRMLKERAKQLREMDD